MRPGVVQQSLDARGEWPTILDLERVVVREGAVFGQIEGSIEARVGLVQRLLTQQIPSGLANVRYGDRLLPRERLLDGQIPLVGARKLQIRREAKGCRIGRVKREGGK